MSIRPLGLVLLLGLQMIISKLRSEKQIQKEKHLKKEREKPVENSAVSCQTCDGLLEGQRHSKGVQVSIPDTNLKLKSRPLSRSLSPCTQTDQEDASPVMTSSYTIKTPASQGSPTSLQLPLYSQMSTDAPPEQSPVTPKDMEVSFTFTLPNSCLVSSRSSNIAAKPRMGISVDTRMGKQQRQWVPMMSQSPVEDKTAPSYNDPEYTQSLDRPQKVSSQRYQSQESQSSRLLRHSTGTQDEASRQTSSPVSHGRYPRTPRTELNSNLNSGGTNRNQYYSQDNSSGTNAATCHAPVRAHVFQGDQVRASGSRNSYPETSSPLSSPNSRPRSTGYLRRRREKEKEKIDVKDMINKFEKQSSTETAPPSIGSAVFEATRKTPSPPIKTQRSSVQRLKTASELKKESGNSSRFHSISNDSNHNEISRSPKTNRASMEKSDSKRSSPSVKDMVKRWSGEFTSDEEGRRTPTGTGTHIKQIIKQLSRETSPEFEMGAPRTRVDSSGSGKGVIIEKTLRKLSNAGLEIPDMQSSLLSQESNKESKKTTKRSSPIKELPPQGLVTKRASQFETKIKSDERNTAVILPVQRESPKIKDTRRNHERKESPSTQRSSKFASFFFPGKEAKAAKKKEKQKKAGTVAALCRQALTMDVDKQGDGGWIHEEAEGTSSSHHLTGTASSSPHLTGTAERRRGRTKFLDRDWLQKPKKLFKVSK